MLTALIVPPLSPQRLESHSHSVNMLGKLSSAYEDLMLESSSTLAGVENTLRQLTWFLPGRFEDAEIASEGCE